MDRAWKSFGYLTYSGPNLWSCPLPLAQGQCPVARLSLLISLWFTLLSQPITILVFTICFWVPFPHCWWCFPGGLEGEESACNVGDLGSDPWAGMIPWRREQLPAPVFWPGESHGQRSLAGYSTCTVHKESGMTEQLSLHFTSPLLELGNKVTESLCSYPDLFS